MATATPLVPVPYPTPRKTTSERESSGQLTALTAWIKNSPSEAYRAMSALKSITPSAAPLVGLALKAKFKLLYLVIFEGKREL